MDNKSALNQILARRQRDDKPLSDPMVAFLTDVYMHQSR